MGLGFTPEILLMYTPRETVQACPFTFQGSEWLEHFLTV